MRSFARFIRSDRGVAAIEYGLLTGLIAAVLLIGLYALSGALSGKLSGLGGAIGAVWSGLGGGGSGG